MSSKRLDIVLAAHDATGAVFNRVTGRVTALTTSIFSMQSAMLAAAGVAGMGLIISKSLDAADKIGKTADAIGITTSTLQEYRHAAELSGVATASIDKSMLGFTKRLGEARSGTGSLAEYLKKTNEELLNQVSAATSTDAALNLIFGAMGETADAAEKAALAAAAFGRSGVAMTVMTKDGAAGLNAMLQEARDLGLVLDEDLIRSSEEANDAISKVTGVIKTGFLTAVTSVSPEITELAEATATWVKNNRELIDTRLDQFISDTGEAATNLYNAVSPIITTAFDAFKNIWGWYSGLPAGVQTMGILGYILAGPMGVAAIVAVGAVVKDITDDTLLAQAGLLDFDGSLDIFTQHYNDFLKAHNLGTEATREQIAAVIRAENELENLSQTTADYTDIVVEGSDALVDQTKALDKNVVAVTAAAESWEDYVSYASIAQDEQDDFADSLTYLDGNLEKVGVTYRTLGEDMVETSNSTWDEIGSGLEQNLTAAFQGEFDSIGGFFDDLLDSMYSMFVSWASKVAAQEIIFSISGGASGANPLGSIFSGGGDSGGSSMMNFAGLAGKAKSGYDYLTGGGLASQFYAPAHTLPAGVAGPTTTGGLTGMGYMSIIGAAVAGQHMLTGFNQKHGYNDVYVNGEKQVIGDAFSGQFLNDPATSFLTGITGGHTSGHQYADAAMMAGDWGEVFKGMAVQFLDLAIGMPFLNPVAKLFGLGDHSEPHMNASLGLGYQGGQLQAIGTSNTSREYSGEYITGLLNGKGNVNGLAGVIDLAVGSYLDTFVDTVNDFSANLPGELGPAFDEAMGSVLEGFKFDSSYHGTDIQEWAEGVMTRLDEELGALTIPTMEAFADLSTAISLVTPAFIELIGVLGDATAAYYDPLLAVDQKILDSSDDPFTQKFKYQYAEDLAQQTNTYQTLYENAVANDLGYETIAKYGMLYTDSLAEFKQFSESMGMYASGVAAGSLGSPSAAFDEAFGADLTFELKGLREDLVSSGGSPVDFQASVMATLNNFEAGIKAGLDSLVGAIKQLHPEIDLDIDVKVNVVGDQATASGSVIQVEAA